MKASPLDAPHFFRERFAPTLGERVAAVLRELCSGQQTRRPTLPPPEREPELRAEIMKDLSFGRT